MRSDHYISAGCKGDRPIKLNGRLFAFRTDPRRAERFGKLAVRLASSRNINLALPRLQHVNGKMGGCAEAEQADAFSFFHACNSQSAKANDAGTEQRSGVKIVELSGNRKAEISAGQSVFGVATIHRVASKSWKVAEVLHFSTAICAGTIGTANPGNTHAGSW